MKKNQVQVDVSLDANAKKKLKSQLNHMKDLSVTISKLDIAPSAINDFKKQLNDKAADVSDHNQSKTGRSGKASNSTGPSGSTFLSSGNSKPKSPLSSSRSLNKTPALKSKTKYSDYTIDSNMYSNIDSIVYTNTDYAATNTGSNIGFNTNSNSNSSTNFNSNSKNPKNLLDTKKIAEKALQSLAASIGEAFAQLKDMDSLLTEISKTSKNLSSSDLSSLAQASFDAADKYGIKTTDYLLSVQELLHAGYQAEEGLADLSAAAQAAGGMTSELANQYIMAADKAYQLGGDVEKLTAILDGSNNIADSNNVTMTELAEAMTSAGAAAAEAGVDTDEAAAALSAMLAVTSQSGADVSRAFQAILRNLNQVADADNGIDAQGLADYEKACNSLNVSLTETKGNVTALRSPMKVLEDLAGAYSALDANDKRKSNLLESLGGGLQGEAFQALLENWDLYEKMQQDYANGSGSMAQDAEILGQSWDSALNRLSNTWTETIGNLAGSDAVLSAIEGLNSLLAVINDLTSALGSFGSIAAGAGILGGIQFFQNFDWFCNRNCLKIARIFKMVYCVGRNAMMAA